MNYKIYGNSGLKVSELCLGTMTFGEEWGWGANKEISKKIFDAYVDRGGNFIDTANVYTNGTSEKYVGEFIKSERERFVLATKYTLSMNPDDPNASGNSRKNMMQSVEASLKRLDTDYIDLLWVHAYDPTVPVQEVMQGLNDLIRQGKVNYIGISDAPAWIVSHANTMAELKGWSEFIGLQIEYSLLERTVERELLPMADYYNLGIAAWSPLAGGLLSGKFSSKNTNVDGTRFEVSAFKELNERNLKIADTVIEIAEEIGKSPAQVSLNWLLNKGYNVFPIIGARKIDQIEDNLNAAEFDMDEEHMEKLDQVSDIELGFPHDFLLRDGIQKLIYGNNKPMIEYY